MAKSRKKTPSRLTESIEVEVPLSTAYNQWTQFEEFPRFMEGVQSVRQLDEARLLWKAEIGGKTVEWQAKIVEQVPDLRISWRSVTGAKNSGVVRFDRLGDARCRVSLDLEYEPEGAIENVGDFLGVVSRRAKGDLQRFKSFIEHRQHETGAWRGEISADPRTH
ncbi:MAG TPA: SRPBCC family protein [Myxococcota bacterium]|nr:SRPBCC family protein [Myxococcota bacterium]